MEVNGVGEFRVFLGSGPGATPERVEWLSKSFPVAGCQRQVIHHGPICRINRAQTVVEQQAFVIIHKASVRLPSKKVARQLHHVISAAVFSRVGAEFGCEFSRIGVPGFMIAGSSGAIAALAYHFIPKIFGDVAITEVSRHFVKACRRDHLRDVRVNV